VDVDIDLDTAPREVSVPADLAPALDAEPEARRTVDGLSHGNQSWHVVQVDGSTTEETRQRRSAKSVDIPIKHTLALDRGLPYALEEAVALKPAEQLAHRLVAEAGPPGQRAHPQPVRVQRQQHRPYDGRLVG
jgi:hypothetical protein